MTGPTETASKACKNTTLYMDATGAKVFVTEHGGIGMEVNGRISVHSIGRWLELSWGDLDPMKQFTTNDLNPSLASRATPANGSR